MFNGMSWGYNVLHYITLVQCPSPFGCRFSLGSALSLRHWYTSCIPTKTCSPNKCKNWSWARYRAKSACKSVCVLPAETSLKRSQKLYQTILCPHQTAMDRGSTSSCPVDSWKIQCNQLHVLLEAAGNATSSRPCLNFHLFGHGIQSQSLYRGRVSQIFCELMLILLRVRFLTKAVQKTLTSLAFPAVAKTVLRML